MEPKDKQTLILAIYKENCDQARHHEIQRERVTAIVASTTGVMLGLLGLGKGGELITPSLMLLMSIFIVLLGLWGFAGSWKHNERAALHRERIGQCRIQLENLSGINLVKINELAEEAHVLSFGPNARFETSTHYIWKTLHVMIALLGFTMVIVSLWRLLH